MLNLAEIIATEVFLIHRMPVVTGQPLAKDSKKRQPLWAIISKSYTFMVMAHIQYKQNKQLASKACNRNTYIQVVRDLELSISQK